MQTKEGREVSFVLLTLIGSIVTIVFLSMYAAAHPKLPDLGWCTMVSSPAGFIDETVQFNLGGQVMSATFANLDSDTHRRHHRRTPKTPHGQMQVVFGPDVHVARICAVWRGGERVYFVCRGVGDPYENYKAWLSDKVKEL